MNRVYLVGSLRNANVTKIAATLRTHGLDVFDNWYSAGEKADDAWRDYEQSKGLNFIEALQGPSAQNVFDFDYRNIFQSDAVVLALPAGKSGHLEFGYAAAQNKPAVILLEDADAERFDVMYLFAGKVTRSIDDAAVFIKEQLAKPFDQRVEYLRQRRIASMVAQFYNPNPDAAPGAGAAKVIDGLQTQLIAERLGNHALVASLAKIAYHDAQGSADAMAMRTIASETINPKT